MSEVEESNITKKITTKSKGMICVLVVAKDMSNFSCNFVFYHLIGSGDGR
jgi:hypothetical protein